MQCQGSRCTNTASCNSCYCKRCRQDYQLVQRLLREPYDWFECKCTPCVVIEGSMFPSLATTRAEQVERCNLAYRGHHAWQPEAADNIAKPYWKGRAFVSAYNMESIRTLTEPEVEKRGLINEAIAVSYRSKSKRNRSVRNIAFCSTCDGIC